MRWTRIGLLTGRITVPDDFNEPLTAYVLDDFGQV